MKTRRIDIIIDGSKLHSFSEFCKRMSIKYNETIRLDEEMIPDEEIENVHGNANFGSISKRAVVNQGVLKCASGYHQGYTSTQIIKDHGLITDKYELTAKGRAYLWLAFSCEHSV